MLYVAWLVFSVVVFSAVIQVAIVSAFVRKLFSSHLPSTPAKQLPKAAVVLSIRGVDPFFDVHLAALLDQDYPEFTVFLIIDSLEDAALPVARRVAKSAPDRIKLLFLQSPLATCSLKCSALAQVVEGLDPSYEVVAFLDGDAPPHKNWLRDLVTPLQEPGVGVSTGNRWYMPQQGDWGSLVRYFWNAGAVVQVWLNGIVWGGSMAMPRKLMLEVGLIEEWRKALFDDSTVVRVMKSNGYKTRFVPSLMLANREEISLPRFIVWAERQMIAAKSCGSNFRLVAMHAFNILCCMLLPICMALIGWRMHDAQIITISLAAAASFWCAAAGSTLAIEMGVRSVLAKNGEKTRWITAQTFVRLVPALVLTHLVYFRMLIGAYIRKRVSWRGIDYELCGAYYVRMLGYQPYRAMESHARAESVV